MSLFNFTLYRSPLNQTHSPPCSTRTHGITQLRSRTLTHSHARSRDALGHVCLACPICGDRLGMSTLSAAPITYPLLATINDQRSRSSRPNTSSRVDKYHLIIHVAAAIAGATSYPMGLLDKLWDDTLAGPRPESGLGRLRKHSSFSPRSDPSLKGGAMETLFTELTNFKSPC